MSYEIKFAMCLRKSKNDLKKQPLLKKSGAMAPCHCGFWEKKTISNFVDLSKSNSNKNSYTSAGKKWKIILLFFTFPTSPLKCCIKKHTHIIYLEYQKYFQNNVFVFQIHHDILHHLYQQRPTDFSTFLFIKKNKENTAQRKGIIHKHQKED